MTSMNTIENLTQMLGELSLEPREYSMDEITNGFKKLCLNDSEMDNLTKRMDNINLSPDEIGNLMKRMKELNLGPNEMDKLAEQFKALEIKDDSVVFEHKNGYKIIIWRSGLCGLEYKMTANHIPQWGY